MESIDAFSTYVTEFRKRTIRPRSFTSGSRVASLYPFRVWRAPLIFRKSPRQYRVECASNGDAAKFADPAKRRERRKCNNGKRRRSPARRPVLKYISSTSSRWDKHIVSRDGAEQRGEDVPLCNRSRYNPYVQTRPGCAYHRSSRRNDLSPSRGIATTRYRKWLTKKLFRLLMGGAEYRAKLSQENLFLFLFSSYLPREEMCARQERLTAIGKLTKIRCNSKISCRAIKFFIK